MRTKVLITFVAVMAMLGLVDPGPGHRERTA